MRYSRQRESLVELLCSTKSHPDAQWLYEELRKEYPNISLGTVYRNLKQLTDDNAIITLETVDKRLHYDGDISRHSHFICNNCGKIIDLFKPSSVPKELNEIGAEISSEKCIYYGNCPECRVNQ